MEGINDCCNNYIKRGGKTVKDTYEISATYPFNLIEEILSDGTSDDEPIECYSIDLMRKVMATYLTDREQRIMEMRYREHMTLEDIGKVYGVTRERIRQVENKCFRKLRNHISEMKAVPYYEYATLKSRYNELLSDKGYTLDDKPVVHIRNLNLTYRTFSSLMKAGYQTIDQLAPLSYKELMRIRGISIKSADEIKEKMSKLGYRKYE